MYDEQQLPTGQTVFLTVRNRNLINEAAVLKCTKNFCTIRFENSGNIKVRESPASPAGEKSEAEILNRKRQKKGNYGGINESSHIKRQPKKKLEHRCDA